MRLVNIAIALAFSVLPIAHVAHAIDIATTGSLMPLRTVVAAPGGAKGLCARLDWACASGTSQAPLTQAQIAAIAEINRSANARIRPVSDLAQYHVAENWVLPSARGGDCEDYALFKKRALIRAGISPDRLLLAAVLDRQRRSHAVLVLRADGADLVLDNMVDAIKPWHRTGYTFLRMQDPRDPKRWVATMVGGLLTGASS